MADIAQTDGAPAASVIGVPLPDVAVYVVDAGMQLCPVGVPGELVVAGAGVARGYLNRAELTAEKFVPDVLTPDAPPDARLYRSGDLAARRDDGDLSYLGRIDQQVKIRGFRIETGEIEAVLRRSGSVRDVAVLAHTRAGGEVVLVAYVVGDASTDAGAPGGPSLEALREAARARLPEYMVPGVFVPVPVIPMTQNGKVDRRALPSPDEHRAAAGGTRVPPSTDLERRIAAVWRQVLGVAEVGVEDGFFDLGGTSLGVVEVAAALRAAGIEVAVVKLFQFTTIAALAAHLEGGT
ncbi:MAG: phosphopantetheine-binding protein, partial [Polyangiaceae bacterium]